MLDPRQVANIVFQKTTIAKILFMLTFSRLSYRYEATILRDRFDQNRNVKDVAKLQKILQESEKELFEKQHYQPIKCICNSLVFLVSWSAVNNLPFFLVPYSPGGVAYGRTLESPDWVLDYWQEEEKARFPEYFAKREQRKKEYVTYWEKKFGKAEEPAHH